LVAVLVGNKLDKEEEREVEYVEGARWAEENG
jgi:Ras-related protein Rab-4B